MVYRRVQLQVKLRGWSLFTICEKNPQVLVSCLSLAASQGLVAKCADCHCTSRHQSDRGPTFNLGLVMFYSPIRNRMDYGAICCAALRCSCELWVDVTPVMYWWSRRANDGRYRHVQATIARLNQVNGQ